MKNIYVSALLLFSLVFFLPARFYVEAQKSPNLTQNGQNSSQYGFEQNSRPSAPQGQTGATSSLSTTTIYDYVASQARKVGINPKLATCIVQHESQFNPTKAGKDTGNTISRGLWQWNDYWHPEISGVCAYDAVCATTKALAWIKSGHIGQWSTYHEYCDNLPVMLE